MCPSRGAWLQTSLFLLLGEKVRPPRFSATAISLQSKLRFCTCAISGTPFSRNVASDMFADFGNKVNDS